MQIVFGCRQEYLEEAQRALIQHLKQALTRHPDRDFRQHIRAHWPPYAGSPEEWAQRFSDVLLSLFKQAQELQNLHGEVSTLQNWSEYLEGKLQEFREDPLQARVKRLRAERDRWQETAQTHAAHIESLEQRLSFTQQRLQQETARLKSEIADLNAIVVRQQEALKQQRS